ncbi:hypothetical protein [Phnomibacter sp. MR]|uniref:hypothetical protein n=1 Tax=Phnomibacter sp. MR TaxID=3042318 RepID=UPI003A811247
MFSFRNEHKSPDDWPFDQRFHWLLNVAVGDNWGDKNGVNPEAFPASLLSDYVRVYGWEK